jgi:hypothetical protein
MKPGRWLFPGALWPSVSLGLLVACTSPRSAVSEAQGPAVAFPAHFAEGDGEGQEGSPPADAGSPAVVAPPPGSQPDPEPLRMARQWEYTIAYDSGKVRVAGVRALLFPQPVVTARKMGRYALELWIGSELVERVRFDFPLLAAEEPKAGPRRPLADPPTFAAGAHVTQRVLLPASPRATRAVLVDRANGATDPLPWPPDAPLGSGSPIPASAADGGASGTPKPP